MLKDVQKELFVVMEFVLNNKTLTLKNPHSSFSVMRIVKVPFINGLGKTKGCELAGEAVLNALSEIHSNEQGKIIDVKLLDIADIKVDNSNVEESTNKIYEEASRIIGRGDKTMFIGGDHSISYSTVKAFFDSVRNEGKKPCLVIFDAHVDLMPPMSEPTHEEWLRALIEDSEVNFPAENILIIGARNLYKSEIEYMNKKKIKTITMNQIAEVGIHEMCDSIMEFAQGKDKELYLSIDIDALDPAYAPATGYNEPGGLTTREFLYILQRINKLKNLRIIDIVEINEKKDKESFHGVTVRLGAKILSEFL